MVCMWRDNDRSCPLIPKGEPPTLQFRPPWGCVLVGCYRDTGVIAEDAHDANIKKMGCMALRMYIEISKSGCLEVETYHETM